MFDCGKMLRSSVFFTVFLSVLVSVCLFLYARVYVCLLSPGINPPVVCRDSRIEALPSNNVSWVEAGFVAKLNQNRFIKNLNIMNFTHFKSYSGSTQIG